MRFTDILRTAFMNLWRRKLRAVLTVLGMVIGVSSIVVMMSLGIGIKKSTMESYASMGSLTNITVSRWSYKETATGGTSTEKNLKFPSAPGFLSAKTASISSILSVFREPLPFCKPFFAFFFKFFQFSFQILLARIMIMLLIPDIQIGSC